MSSSSILSSPSVVGGVFFPIALGAASFQILVRYASVRMSGDAANVTEWIGYGLLGGCALFAIHGLYEIIAAVSRQSPVRILPQNLMMSIDPREDLTVIPPLDGELTDEAKAGVIELIAQSTSWEDLQELLAIHGYRLVAHGRGLCLAKLDAQIEVLCTVKSLGRGCDLHSLRSRLGSVPANLKSHDS